MWMGLRRLLRHLVLSDVGRLLGASWGPGKGFSQPRAAPKVQPDKKTAPLVAVAAATAVAWKAPSNDSSGRTAASAPPARGVALPAPGACHGCCWRVWGITLGLCHVGGLAASSARQDLGAGWSGRWPGERDGVGGGGPGAACAAAQLSSIVQRTYQLVVSAVLQCLHVGTAWSEVSANMGQLGPVATSAAAVPAACQQTVPLVLGEQRIVSSRKITSATGFVYLAQ
jgi:hypothetical protein